MKKFLILISFFLLNCGGSESPTSSQPEVLELSRVFFDNGVNGGRYPCEGENGTDDWCNGLSGEYRAWRGFSIYDEPSFSDINDIPNFNPSQIVAGEQPIVFAIINIFDSREYIRYHVDEGYFEIYPYNSSTNNPGGGPYRVQVSSRTVYQYQLK